MEKVGLEIVIQIVKIAFGIGFAFASFILLAVLMFWMFT